ncbi:MAG TPA: type II secretion system minor pseudopilin GspK [Hydrogenophaga sp.]|nr:type II secretion system minor pseudopilin GspK [Hydrogenophaga sp.]
MSGACTSRLAARSQQGAALLLAMLTVTLVATMAAAAMWQQWRAAEVEMAERQRMQASWILTGALDWSRLILREDARANQNSGNGDHLGEPWAMPLEEARLTSFLAVDKNNNTDDVLQAFLSGEIIDLQSRMNFTNLVRTTGDGAEAKAVISETDMLAFTRLFELLDLPQSELTSAANELVRTHNLALSDPKPSPTALAPKKLAHLAWLGIRPSSLAVLEPHTVVLPMRTTLNINTASRQAMAASIQGLDMARAQQLIYERERSPFKSLNDAELMVRDESVQLSDLHHGARSRFFEIRGRLRLDDVVIEERSLVVRSGLKIRVVWRERIAGQ